MLTLTQRLLTEKRLRRAVESIGECRAIARSGHYPANYRAEADRIEAEVFWPLYDKLEADDKEKQEVNQNV